MKEYGSNIQKLVDNIVNIEDREKRTRYAHILVELMRQIHPNMKDGQDYYNKLWDDLYIMSGFTLDVDSPYPPPSKEVLGRKPQQVPYNMHNLRYKHYGRNMELLIDKAATIDDPEEKRAFVSYLARLMKTFYATWNKESVEDETIFTNLEEMSDGRLNEDLQGIRNGGMIEGTPRERTGDRREGGGREGGYREGGSGNRPYGSGYQNQHGGNRDNRDGGRRGEGGHRGQFRPNNRDNRGNDRRRR
ncbi:hypothetical protein GCM10023189_36700 [Nibrella saemangeumensis]|uniref:DUF4290 domain-containing protein n=1 Tax=Nibrella saemangeumensis TaxID=1084526 RepID=A0ABP8N4P1_9BACT